MATGTLCLWHAKTADVSSLCRASFKQATGSFSYSLLVGLLLNLILVALLNVAIALEDPFDNVRLYCVPVYIHLVCSLPERGCPGHEAPCACDSYRWAWMASTATSISTSWSRTY